MAAALSLKDLHKLRAARCLLDGGRRIGGDGDAVRFIAERGFVLLMPIAGIPLPSLSEADGAAPWAEDFRCTDRAWAWKETLPGAGLCAYTKLVGGRGTFISWRMYPAFLAVYGPAGDPAEEYEAGRLARADRDLIELVGKFGPINSRDLWRRAKPLFGGKRHQFTAALERLQAKFLLTVSGGSLEGWTLHTWDLVERQAPPGLLDELPPPAEARREILFQTLQNAVAMPEGSIGRILRWTPAETGKALAGLMEEGKAARVQVGKEEWVGPAI